MRYTNPAIASRLQSNALVRRVAELLSLGGYAARNNNAHECT